MGDTTKKILVSDRRRLDRIGKFIQVAAGILTALIAVLGVWLALRDAVGTNATDIKHNRETIIRIEGQLEAQRTGLDTIKVQQAEFKVSQQHQADTLRRMERTLDKLAQGK